MANEITIPDKIWDNNAAKNKKMPIEIIAFYKDIIAVYKKHNLSISHEDGHGNFEIEENNQFNMEWLVTANKCY